MNVALTRWCKPLAALTVAVIAPRTAAAGEQLQLDELVARTNGAATVRVSLGSGKEPARVEIIRVHGDPVFGATADPSWVGTCLPDRATLRQWTHQFPRWRERRLWDQLIRQPGYEALVFLKLRDDRPYPYCEVERMRLEHTSIHPQYHRYREAAREKVKQAVQALGASDPVPERLIEKLCTEGTCQGRGHSALITVMRDKERNVALLIYTALGCSHPTVRYLDRWGTHLVYQQTGPREADEWNSPDDLKIRDLRQGLTKAEIHSCRRYQPLPER